MYKILQYAKVQYCVSSSRLGPFWDSLKNTGSEMNTQSESVFLVIMRYICKQRIILNSFSVLYEEQAIIEL
jgi:hypothetical protein